MFADYRSMWAALALVCAAAASMRAAEHGYVVAVDSETAKDAAWMEAANALRRKHNGDITTYPIGKPDAILPLLRRSTPQYVCFVSSPEHAGRELVVNAARTVRRIDDDPFGDALWGIVTGFDASDAMRMASTDVPLVARRAATSMGGDGFFNGWDGGFASDEGCRNRFWTKTPGHAAERREVEPDPARALAESFREIPIDYWCTSGHATERNWQIVFNQNAGFVVHRTGTLLARSSFGFEFPFSSPSPKVYIAAGNCLIGHIDRRDCMATAWIHSGGVNQMVAYTVVTFYGFMGWGTKALFESGAHSLAESFFLNNQILLWKLRRKNPALLEMALPSGGDFSPKAMTTALNGVAKSTDELGLFWDRDTVAFYGDPAWRATCPEERRDVKIVADGDAIHIRFLRDATFPDSLDAKDMRPLCALLPRAERGGASLVDACTGKPLEGAEVAENFALLPVTGCRKAGEKMDFKIVSRHIPALKRE